MEPSAQRLQGVLDGCGKFLREKQLAPAKQHPHLMSGVREFQGFAREHPGYTFEQTLDLFLEDLGGAGKTAPSADRRRADGG
jgi:hypothetical protein